MQGRKHHFKKSQGSNADAGHSFAQPISYKELERKKKEIIEMRVGDKLNSETEELTRFLKVTTSSEMGEFIEYIFGLMEKSDRNETIGGLLNYIAIHISEATPQAVMTALRSTFHYRDQYKPSWLGLLESARKDFANRAGVDVDSLLTGLHA